MTVIDDVQFLAKNYCSKTTYAVENPNSKLLKIKSNNDGNVVEESYADNTKIVLEYDKNSNIVLETWYNAQNTIVYCEKHQYDFDENGKLKASYFAKFEGSQTNNNWQVIEQFDEDGNLISVKKDYEGDGNIDFVEEYDHVLASRTKTIYNAQGKIINIQQYEYDFEGNLMSVTFDKDGDGTIEYEQKYQ
ncbi:MAG: hypothetical protein IJY61_05325 [Candidatus Gastranaerophilales bacterium]|nr:hypothetical protein [Candidatus Gastranaerophilales bacterium]